MPRAWLHPARLVLSAANRRDRVVASAPRRERRVLGLRNAMGA